MKNKWAMRTPKGHPKKNSQEREEGLTIVHDWECQSEKNAILKKEGGWELARDSVGEPGKKRRTICTKSEKKTRVIETYGPVCIKKEETT